MSQKSFLSSLGFTDTYDKKVDVKGSKKNGQVLLNLMSEEKFREWMGSKEAFPFDPQQLTLTDGMVEFAYAMYRYCIEVHNGQRDPGENEITADYTVPYGSTNVTVPVTEKGMRAQLTVYNGDVSLILKEEDYWTPNLLNIYNPEGKLEILQFREVDEKELNSLFLTYGWVYYGLQLMACCPQLSIEEILNTSIVENQEIRALILAQPHNAKLLATQLGKPVDVFTNEKYLGTPGNEERVDVYRLFKGRIGGAVDVTYVNCYCPSTGRDFMLGVDNKYNNVKDGIASLVEIPEGLHPYIDKIFRQGEVFGVTYTGIDTNSKEFMKLNGTTRRALTGEVYFEKLAFES